MAGVEPSPSSSEELKGLMRVNTNAHMAKEQQLHSGTSSPDPGSAPYRAKDNSQSS